MTTPLGRLERHELRTAWNHEATGFTPWLAQKENLDLLADALDMQLELEVREKPVGPFRADLLCRDVGDDHWVLIENQLERTNHGHLGQLLTYASGLEAVTIVWIAAKFSEEHRATLDWLNRITDDRFRFFGVEVEVWRIGDSAAAPKFNIVSKPNGWSEAVARAARALDETDLSPTRVLQRDYWAAFNKVLDAAGGAIAGNKKPQPQAWISFPTGRNRIHVNGVMVRPRRQLRAELYIGGLNAKSFFRILIQSKSEIEAELGYPLIWDEMPDCQDSRISCSLDDVDIANETDWSRQHEWLARHLNDLHRVFVPRIGLFEPAEAFQPDAA